MPFRKKARITLENLVEKPMILFHHRTMHWHPYRTMPRISTRNFVGQIPFKDVYTIVDGIKGKGQYMGTYIAWGVHNNGGRGKERSNSKWMAIMNFVPSTAPELLSRNPTLLGGMSFHEAAID